MEIKITGLYEEDGGIYLIAEVGRLVEADANFEKIKKMKSLHLGYAKITQEV
jgi:hypothetical protein